VRSISFKTFFLNNRNRAIYRRTHQILSNNFRSHVEFRLFISDSVRVITFLVKSVFFIRHGGGNEQRVAIKFCFKAGLSETETLVLVQKAYGNEALNRSNVFR
jgi:hypothetical protein